MRNASVRFCIGDGLRHPALLASWAPIPSAVLDCAPAIRGIWCDNLPQTVQTMVALAPPKEISGTCPHASLLGPHPATNPLGRTSSQGSTTWSSALMYPICQARLMVLQSSSPSMPN